MRFYVDILGFTDNSAAMSDIRVNYSLTGDVNAADFAEGTFDDEEELSCTDRALEYDSDTDSYYVQLNVQGDTLVEASERFVFHLDEAYNDSDSGGAVEIAQSGLISVGLIEGDDYGLQIVSANLNQAEDKGRFVFEVLRSGPTDTTMSVDWQVGVPDQTLVGEGVSADDFIDATTGRPYAAASAVEGTVTFLAGETTGRFTLEVAHDFTAENAERFCVMAEVTEIGGVEIDNSASPDMFAYTEGTITNDDGEVPDSYVPPAMLEPIQDPHATQ
jgi:hypothetical protein